MSNPNQYRLPTPKQLSIVPLNEMELAEMIERHIDFVDDQRRSVHLGTPFVRHFLKRDDHKGLPKITSIAQTPIVLRDGTILSGQELNRKYGIYFEVPVELDALLPQRADCTDEVVADAMRYLTDEWLCDVATDYPGKCVLVACLMTVLERALIPERPAFFVTAGKRGGGKTTALNMISMAATGLPASAMAWSTNEEERRKSLFALLGAGIPFVVWDNISKGSTISCPSIERSLTIEFYTDRVLGFSETRTVPTYTVQGFSGNNVAAKGDLASRSLTARLAVDRPDPENRKFRHADGVSWTDANRGRILQAAYTILLGNPRRDGKEHPAAPTRFKVWWDVVGSAVEHAAKLTGGAFTFQDLFLAAEDDEEEGSNLLAVIETIRTKWPRGGTSAEIAAYAGEQHTNAIAFRGALEAASGKAIVVTSSTVITWRLKALVDAPIKLGETIVALRFNKGHEGGSFIVKPVENKPQL